MMGNLTDLPALLEGHDLKQLVHSPDPSRSDNQRRRLKDHPELPGEEIVELEGEGRGDVGV